MVRIMAMVLGGLVLASPAVAQDMLGAVNLPDLARTQVQSSTADGYAERGSSQVKRADSTIELSEKSKRYCEDVPALRARKGVSDPKVQRLANLCRSAGYRY